ncbi:MAG: anaerobic ribonucleoside-triphosphate reductase activating protein [Thermodesulfobacteriota bacterium]
MLIGGLQKTTVIDYPGKVSCVLFCAGCNFRCPYCHNPDLISVAGDPFMSLDQFFDFLSLRRGFLDGVVVTGGEPTLDDGILSLCRRIKEKGMAVKLDTNGSRPAMLDKLLDAGVIDYIAMDIKTRPANYTLLAGKNFDCDRIRSSIKIIKHSGLPYEFRTTCARPFVDEAIMEKISDLAAGAPLYVLQRCRTKRMLAPEFFAGREPFADWELDRFREIAAGKVGRCYIR